MSDLNKAIVVGRLGQDPELRYTNNGKPVANLSVATSEKWKDQNGQMQERTEWHKVVVWGRSAEFVGNYMGKGDSVFVEGKLQTSKWQDQQSGQNRYKTEIVVQPYNGSIGFAGSRQQQGQGQQQGGGGYQRPPQQRQPQGRDDSLGPSFPSEATGMDDVPF